MGITDLGQTNKFTYLSSVRLQVMSVDLDSPFLEGTGDAHVCQNETSEQQSAIAESDLFLRIF